MTVQDRALKALSHPQLKRLLALIPEKERNDPRSLSSWLTVAADADPRGADSPAFEAAYGAVKQWGAANDLWNRIGRAYHDPKLRAEIGEDRVKQAWADPETAYAELIQRSAAGRLSPALDEALNTLGEARHFATEMGVSLPQPATAPTPANPAELQQEIEALVQKSVAGTLTKAEDARLTELYAVRLARDTAAEDAAAARPQNDKRPGEYERLIEKSISGGLSPDEDARLNSLTEARAIAQGLIEPADLGGDYDTGDYDTGGGDENV